MKSLIPFRSLLRRISCRMQFKSLLYSQASASSSSSYYCEEMAVVNEVLNVVETANPMEPVLEEVVHIFTPEIVASVLEEEKKHSPELGFRFFIWAAKRKCFRSWVSHNLVVDMLCSSDCGFDLYWKILDEASKRQSYLSSDAFSALIWAYWKVKKPEKAVETFGRMKYFDCKPQLFTYNTILHVLIQKDVTLLALAVYNMMLKSNARLNSSTFTILIRGLFKNGKTQDAQRLFDEMSERGILPSKLTYTVFLSGLCQAKRIDDAIGLFNSMKSRGCQLDNAVFNVLLDGFCKMGRMDEAFKLLESFKEDGYIIGKQGYSSLIDGLIRDHRIDEAHALFQQLVKMDITPDLVLYTIMMRGLSEAGRVKNALNLLRDMTQRGVIPDTFCYNTLIKGFCDMGLLDEARSLRMEISNNNLFPDTCTYTILLSGMCKNGLIGEARHIFNEMEKHGCLPSVMTFNSLIEGLCKAGNLKEAQLLFYKMEIGRNPSLFLRLTHGADRVLDNAGLQARVEELCESGYIIKAYELLMQLGDSGVVPNLMTYNILINGFCKAGQIDPALKLLEVLQRKGHSLMKSHTGLSLMGSIGLVVMSTLSSYLNRLKKIHSFAIGPEIYRSLMAWSCRKRKTDLAFSIWMEYMKDISGEGDEAIKLVQKHFEEGNLEMAIRGLLKLNLGSRSFDSAPYNIWLIGLVQARRTEEAVRYFWILEELRVTVSGPSFVALIDQLCFEGKLDEAIKIFMYTMKNGLRLMPRICNKLVRVLSKERRNDVFYLLKEMESAGYDLGAFLFRRTKSRLRHHWSAIREIEVCPG